MRRIAVISATALCALILPGTAFGQATRTWVSGVGDDANPCSRTAPCKTFAGAISKTAPSGEIDVLDDGGFGAVTITKAITIDGGSHEAGVLVSGTNGIIVSAGASDKVRLLGLDINGIGTGLNGVRVISGKSVSLYNSRIYNFTQNGFDFESSTSGAKGVVQGSIIEDNTGNGVFNAPPAGGNGKVQIRNSNVSGNGCGVAGTNHGGSGVGANCGTGSAANGLAKVTAIDNAFDSNANAGIFSNGQTTFFRVGGNEITDNLNGLLAIDVGASPSGIFSFGANFIGGNGTNGSPNGNIPPE
jgi:hypothetical protein